MKKFLPLLVVVLSTLGCSDNKPLKQVQDNRPKEQEAFLKKHAILSNLYNYEYLNNDLKRDSVAESFAQYLKDSVSEIKNWRFAFSLSSKFKHLDKEYYIIGLNAPINDEEVSFNFILPQIPENQKQRDLLNIIRPLQAGDKLSITGMLIKNNNEFDSSSAFTIKVDSVSKN